MKRLAEAAAGDLVWTRTARFSRAWELRSGDEVVASLTWPSTFSSRAVAVADGARWEFLREGTFRARVVLRDGAGGPEPARFERRFGGGGEIVFPDGRRLLWSRGGLIRSTWSFTTSDGFPVVTFSSELRWFRSIERLQIDETARSLSELPLLALVGWYLVILTRRNRAAR
ncbi:MAG TPA: hypothetical protein VGK94_00105 [Candidatus Polarisedimenticolia bacterium]|jgi:hypothetical protein